MKGYRSISSKPEALSCIRSNILGDEVEISATDLCGWEIEYEETPPKVQLIIKAAIDVLHS